MADIYDQHQAAFAQVSAYAILNEDNQQVAKIAFKFPRDGAGRLYAYVHWLGVEMVRGYAGGFGYDKRSAAVAHAVSKMRDGLEVNRWEANAVTQYDAFLAALAQDSGQYWDSRLREAGFQVLQAV